ncbi:hypothetical protein [Leifsonia sp. 21MFCrub1.1]|uniref:hypothetical protein n=1 Tax=Leifsonia sp. 21MFCrub1.1 TaxID=1798223 RepID=UPI001E43D37E|nr:hypothetical protein [Leifsonia sp. 21MFCrub1.1]
MSLGAALVLAGCAQGAPAGQSTSHTAMPSPTPTPTPVITTQPVRVPTTCDQLMPPAALAQIGTGLVPEEEKHRANLSSWMNDRVGALTCSWSNGAADADLLQFIVKVGPEVTREGFEGFLNGEQGGGIHYPGAEPDSYTLRVQDKPIGFLFLTPHYGVAGYLVAGLNAHFPADADATSLRQIYGVVSALGAPGPLWTPSPTLTGATGCDGLATADQLGSLGGLPSAREVKSDAGEYSLSVFDIDRQVGGYWCWWLSEDSSVTASIAVGVLPGGGEYAKKVRPAGSVDVPGFGTSAYRSPDGVLNVIAAGGWVQMGGYDGVTPEQQTAFTKQVLRNVGYTG